MSNPTSAEPFFEVQDVHNGTFGGVYALNRVSLTIREGLLHGLAGPNGSGKSTLLAAMSRLRSLTSGNIIYLGANVSKSTPDALARLGLVRTFQTVRLVPDLTVLENVMLGADVHVYGTSFAKQWLRPQWTRRKEAKVRERGLEMIERVGLTEVTEKDPLTLPYGTQRRIEIARALSAEPRLLLLDEPTAGMNREERDEIGALLLSLRDEGVTQVLVEHDVEMLVQVCDHLFVLDSGRMIASDSPLTCISRPEVQEAYFGVASHVSP